MYRITAEKDGNEVTIHGRTDDNARVVGGKLTEYVNTIPTFSFTIYPNNPGYNMMESMQTTITVYDRKSAQNIFIGRVYSVADVMTADGMIYKNVSCEGELAYLCDTVQPYQSFATVTLLETVITTFLNNHNLKVGNSRKIYAGGSYGSIGLPEAYEVDYISTFDAVKGACELCGYEFKLTYSNGSRYLEVSQQFGRLSGTEIALSVNLKSLQRSIEAKDIVTRFYPLGINKENDHHFTISSVAPYKHYIVTPDSIELESIYGVIEAAKVYNDITIEDSDHISAGAAKLYAAGLKDYNKMIGLLTSFSIQAVDLSLINGDYDSLRIYNTYRVITKLQGIDDEVRLTGRTLMLDEPQNPTLTFGQKQTTLTGMLAGR